MRQSWNQRSTSAENAWGSFSPEAMSISTRCHGWHRGRDIALRCPRTARRSMPTWRDFACRLRRPQQQRRRPRILPLFHVNNATIGRVKIETSVQEWSSISMKTLSLMMAMFFLLFSAVVSRGANLTRISNETGVPVATLQAERTSTGLGWGGLEKAHLLANSSGQSFDTVVGKFQGGEGWGKIAHDYGLNLGKVVSGARRSSHATSHGTNAHANKTTHGKSSVHGKSATALGKGHAGSMRSFSSSGRSAGHGMSGMGHGMG